MVSMRTSGCRLLWDSPPRPRDARPGWEESELGLPWHEGWAQAQRDLPPAAPGGGGRRARVLRESGEPQEGGADASLTQVQRAASSAPPPPPWLSRNFCSHISFLLSLIYSAALPQMSCVGYKPFVFTVFLKNTPSQCFSPCMTRQLGRACVPGRPCHCHCSCATRLHSGGSNFQVSADKWPRPQVSADKRQM